MRSPSSRRRDALLLALLALAVAGGTSPASAADPGPLLGATIVLDPGHNPGNASHAEQINHPVFAATPTATGNKPCDTVGTATADGYPEYAFNWDVARRLSALLRADGARVIFTRTAHAPAFGPCIDERAKIGNRVHAAAAISIHADGGPAAGRGFAAIVPAAAIPAVGLTKGMVSRDLALARAIIAAFAEGTAMPRSDYLGRNGLYRSNDYGGTNLSRVPKIFIETGNMRNPTDARLLRKPAFRQRIAVALEQGLATFLSERRQT